ncbi:hypothetical protein CHS0354_010146 [Potamilus streckersoni]|uniref:TIR domain-containing protein n=1 Tax=Potamilus streckersoni TaxID=2493646 RepID=A0AAE0RQH5_9BIVA|nr:hypothetical protein CHS0354_010146 [Potamilus streckersoni]
MASYMSKALAMNVILDLSRLNADAAVQIIDMSNNKLVYVNLTILGTDKVQQLQKLDLSGNGMEYIAPSSLRLLSLLKVLDMAENNLLSMQTTEDFSNLFRSATELRVLSLRNNHLTALPKTCFSSNTKLQLLDLRHNDLNDFNIDLSNMWSLKYIDLRNNRLHNLSLGMIHTLENISRHQMTKTKGNESNAADIFSLYRLDKIALAATYGYGQSIDMTRELPKKEEHMYWNLTIDLYGNPLQCDCESIYFIQWIISTNIIIVDMESLVCKYGNDLYPLNRETLDKVHFDCVSFPILIKIVVSSVTIGIVCASVFAFLALCIRRTSRRAKHMEFFKRLIQKVDAKLKFVVFLPFCSQDQDIVEKYIRPSLNNLLKQKLNINIREESELVCCGDRNFIPGLPIITEIHRCIDESLVVVPVITPSFLKSRWCKSECTVAIQKARNVVVLMKEQTDTSDADKMIRNLIYKYTRASWAVRDGEFIIRPKWDILIQSIVDKAMETACNGNEKTEIRLNRREEVKKMVGLLDSEEEEDEL